METFVFRLEFLLLDMAKRVIPALIKRVLSFDVFFVFVFLTLSPQGDDDNLDISLKRATNKPN